MQNNAVISLGGSTIFNEKGVDIDFIRKFSNEVKKSLSRGAIIVGGGKIARVYSSAMRELTNNEFFSDDIAIKSTRQNALLIKHAIGKEAEMIKYPKQASGNSRFYVSGGYLPGLTTDACSVLVAEVMGINKIINISNIDAVYDKDPKLPGAKKIRKINIDDFFKLAEKSDDRKAGTNFIFDVVGAKLAMRSLKEIHFVGKDIEEIKKAIHGKEHNGTVCKI